MNTIIQCFLEKIISLEEKSLENLNNINFFSDFTDNLNFELMDLGREIAKTLTRAGIQVVANYNKSEQKAKELKEAAAAELSELFVCHVAYHSFRLIYNV